MKNKTIGIIVTVAVVGLSLFLLFDVIDGSVLSTAIKTYHCASELSRIGCGLVLFFILLVLKELLFSNGFSTRFEVMEICDKIFRKSRVCTLLLTFLFLFLVFFGNFDIYAICGGKDIRFLSDGRYCYNVKISRENSNGKLYTLPASVRKETEGFNESKYYIEKVFFKNGGYLVFDGDNDYIEFDGYDDFYDQDGVEWSVELTNTQTTHEKVKTSKSDWFIVCITILEILSASVFSIYYFTQCDHTTKNFKVNSERLKNIVFDLIDEYEDNIKPSCKDEINPILQQQINLDKKDIENWNDYDTDYIKIAHTFLANTTFDLLSSGRYHIYSGTLNPMNCSSNLLKVYNNSMEYALSNKHISKEEREEQYNFLMKRIREIG